MAINCSLEPFFRNLILYWMVPNMYGVLSSIFDIFRLLQMASEDQKVMKKHRRPDFILVSGLLQPLIYKLLA